MEQDIKDEWALWCKCNAELQMQEIAQARRTADFLSGEALKKDFKGAVSAHVGECSVEFIKKVAYFLPPTWVSEYTDEKRGWDNTIKVYIK